MDSNSSTARPDLRIPIPASFVSAAGPPPPPPPSHDHHQQPPVKLNMAATIAAAAAAAAAAANNAPQNGAAAGGDAAAAAAAGGSAAGTIVTEGGKKVRYRECLKNHAAGIGGHALDGCGEFMPSKEGAPAAVAATCDDAPPPLRCAACGCHRNFHRREVEGEKPPPCDQCRRRQAPSDGTPHSGGGSGPLKKRFRTKFSGEQKDRMYMLSEKLGWRIQKHDEAEVAQFCADTGVKRHVLKVWMHNNKHTFANKKGVVMTHQPASSSPSSSSHQHLQLQQQQQQHHQHHDPT